MDKKPKNIIKLVFILLFYFSLPLMFSFIFTKIGFDISKFSTHDYAYAEGLIGVILFGVVWYVYRKKLKIDFDEFKINLKDNLKKCVNIFFILLAVKLLSGLITGVLSILLNTELVQSDNQTIIENLISKAPLMMFLSSVIIAPFTEEVIFRLGFKKVIKERRAFIIISGLVFGLLHIIPSDLGLKLIIIQSVIYVSMGIALAYIYEENKNIFYVIVPHAFNNLLGLVAALLLL